MVHTVVKKPTKHTGVKITLIVVGVILVASVAYIVGARNSTKQDTTAQAASTSTKPLTDQTATKTTTPVTTTQVKDPSSPTADAPATVNGYNTSILFSKGYYNLINSESVWADSPVQKQYRDFTKDGTMDVLVYSTIPGTAKVTYFYVFTVKNTVLQLLFALSESDTLQQSSLSLDAQNGIIYTGFKQTGSSDPVATTVTYRWDGAGHFVPAS